MLRKLFSERREYVCFAFFYISLFSGIDLLVSNCQVAFFWEIVIFLISNLILFLFGFAILSNLYEIEEKINALEEELERKEEKEQQDS